MQCFLYTCSTEEGALKEVKGEANNFVDIIEWELIGNVKILDLTQQDSPLLNFCQFEVGDVLQNEPSYLIPNFLVQCCQSVEMEGSVNYIFFDHQEKWFKKKNLKKIS